eukprot:3356336-Pleurochrysis_carterae.AAC.3
MFFYRQRNPVSLPVPTPVALPRNRAYVQFCGAPATGQTMVSNVTQAQSQQINYPRVTAKLRDGGSGSRILAWSDPGLLLGKSKSTRIKGLSD